MQKASNDLRPSTGPVVRQIRSRENSMGGTKHPLECARAESTVVRVRLQLPVWRGGKTALVIGERRTHGPPKQETWPYEEYSRDAPSSSLIIQ